MVVISVYTYGVKIIKKFRWESGFLWGGSMVPPTPPPPCYALMEVRGTLKKLYCPHSHSFIHLHTKST